jgi:hypothetical protein
VIAALLANLSWAASAAPGWLRFRAALQRPEGVQRRLLARTLAQNSDSVWGREHGFADIRGWEQWQEQPLCSYADFDAGVQATARGQQGQLCSEPVLLLEPTSGSSGANRLIPYTAGLQRQYRAAIDPWMFSLYLRRPRLLLGRHYWSVSPSTPCDTPADSVLPIGFAEDAEYLGRVQRWLTGALFAAPASLAQVQDPDSHAFLTALFLLAERRLGLVSVWHPSALLLLLEAMLARREALAESLATGRLPADLVLPPGLGDSLEARLRPAPARALQLRNTSGIEQIHGLWPQLQVISCWDQGRASADAARIRALFPGVWVQGKGLLATEGAVTIPWGDGPKVCALCSHLLEFRIPGTDRVLLAHQLEQGAEYSPLLTTAGGLYRYELGDLVRCTGFVGRAPCLDFLARAGRVCDLVGEKLGAAQVERAMGQLEGAQPFRFSMLAPEPDGRGYAWYLEDPAGRDPDTLGRALEERLAQGYHYAHARRIGQLRALRIQPVQGGMARYRQALVERGAKAGDIKQEPLHLGDFWRDVFSPEGSPGP